jgi:hypothetical protein
MPVAKLAPLLALALSLALVLLLPAGRATASVEPAQICDRAAAVAARETGVPVEILQAISRVETGRRMGGRLTPWPWTANFGGPGAWFASPEEALARVRRDLAAGATNIDVGCFQVNIRWHGKEFPSLEAMFDPETNARYAARYLLELRAEQGDWPAAIGAYHSRTPERAEGYLAKVEGLIGAQGGAAPQGGPLDLPADLPQRLARAPRENTFPLLQEGGGRSPGSLVATDRPAEPLFLFR